MTLAQTTSRTMNLLRVQKKKQCLRNEAYLPSRTKLLIIANYDPTTYATALTVLYETMLVQALKMKLGSYSTSEARYERLCKKIFENTRLRCKESLECMMCKHV